MRRVSHASDQTSVVLDAAVKATGPDTRLGRACGLLVVLAVVAVDPAGWYPFTVAKLTAVALAVVWCWWAAFSSKAMSRLARPVTWGLIMLTGLLAVSAVFGREPIYSWIGTPERSLGVLTWCGFAACAYSGARLTERDRIVLARWCVVAGLAAGAYAVAERWFGPPIEVSSNTTRLMGPFGSAAMFGAAWCLLLPVSIGVVAVSSGSPRWRWAAVTSVGLGSFALVGTGSRAAWLGCVVAAVVAATALRHRFAAGQRNLGSAVVTPVAACVVAFVGGLVAGIVSSPDAAGRVASGGSSRLAEWQVGWGIVRAHPVLGVGPEGYRTALADGMSAAYERDYGRSVTPDRAHNVVLDVAAAGGVLAALVYVAIVAVVVLGAWRWIRDRGPVEVGIAAAVIAYASQQLFLFPVAVIDPIWWVFAGAVVAVQSAGGSPPERSSLRHRSSVVLAAVAAVALLGAGVLGIAADRLAKDALAGPGSVAAAERAVDLRPDVVRYRLLAADAATRSPTIAGIRAALDHTHAALGVSPHDPIVLLADADYALLLAQSTGSAADVEAAMKRWSALADADHNCYACHLGLGYAAALAGEHATSREAFERAVQLARPGDAEAADALARLVRP